MPRPRHQVWGIPITTASTAGNGLSSRPNSPRVGWYGQIRLLSCRETKRRKPAYPCSAVMSDCLLAGRHAVRKNRVQKHWPSERHIHAEGKELAIWAQLSAKKITAPGTLCTAGSLPLKMWATSRRQTLASPPNTCRWHRRNHPVAFREDNQRIESRTPRRRG